MSREAFGRKDGDSFTTLAVRANGFVFTTGNIGYDPETGELPPDIESQTKFTLLTLQRVLEDAGTSIQNVIKVNVYMTDVEDEFERMNAAYADYFASQGITEPPARTTIGAQFDWSKVEMDMVALA